MAYVFMLAGLGLLVIGGELLVRGASALARAVGLPSLIIGLTVVAFGTSAPELAVGLKAGLGGQADLAFGNVVGSNCFNILFILGAQLLGVSELLIGLTIVAAGTSLPELATSVVASIRRERDLAVGNIVGSNIFNLMAVLGASAAASPAGVAASRTALRFDVPVMMAVAMVCLPIFFTGGRISRWEGALLLGYYVAYVTYLVLGASHHESLPAFSAAMFFFVLPGTVLGIAVSVVCALRTGKAQRM